MDIKEYINKLEKIWIELDQLGWVDGENLTPGAAALVVGILSEMRKDERQKEATQPKPQVPTPAPKPEAKQPFNPMTENQRKYLENNRIPIGKDWGSDEAYAAIGKHKAARLT